MTPLAMEMLIWFYTRAPEAGEFPNIRLGPQSAIVDGFLADAIIEQVEGFSTPIFKTTLKGEAWLKLALQTPVPVQQWVDPRSLELTF